MNLNRLTETMVRSLIRHAAVRTPPPLAERLEEEWLADLEARTGQLSRLRFALGCCWAANVIAYGQPVPKAAVAASVSGMKGAIAFVPSDRTLLSRRSVALLLIAAVHGLVIYAFTTGLAHQVISAIVPPISSRVIEEPRAALPKPPPSVPDLTRPRIDPVYPDLPKIDIPTDQDAIRQVASVEPSHPTLPPLGTAAVTRVTGGPGKGFPNTEDFYPSVSRRMGEVGISTVRVCVDGAGRLTADPSLVQTSGSARLDEGALKLARAGSGHYRATTEDGRAVDSCYPFRVKFALTN